MKRDSATIVIILASLIVLGIILVIASYRWTVSVGGKLDDFAKTAAVWATLLTSLSTAAVTAYVAYRQRNASTELENLKAKLTTNLEFLKARFSAERKAYDELFAAAVIYYHTLARLELGLWDRRRARKAEDAMLAACRYTIAVEDEHRAFWMRIWQKSRSLAEAAGQLQDKDERKDLWRNNVKEYGQLLKAFHEAAFAKHEFFSREEEANV